MKSNLISLMKGLRTWPFQIFTVIHCFCSPFVDLKSSYCVFPAKLSACVCLLLICSQIKLYCMNSEFNKSLFMHIQIAAYTKFTSFETATDFDI